MNKRKLFISSDVRLSPTGILFIVASNFRTDVKNGLFVINTFYFFFFDQFKQSSLSGLILCVCHLKKKRIFFVQISR